MPTKDQIVGAGVGAALGPVGAVYGYFAGRKRHSSITWTDINGNIQHAETQAQKNAFDKMLKDRQFGQDLKKYDTASNQFQNQVKSDFNQSSQLQGAQAVGAVATSANLAGNRAGLGSEYTQALGANAQTQLRSQVVAGQMSFDQAVTAMAEQDKLGFVRHEIGFFQGLQTLAVQTNLSKELAEFQAHLQSDLFSKQLILDTLGIGAQIFGMKFGAAPAAAASNTNAWGGFGP